MPTEHFNGLTEAEAERLAILIEECGEVIHAASKILRHGYDSWNPDIPNPPNNRSALVSEIGGIMRAIGRMEKNGDVPIYDLTPANYFDLRTENRYLHHQGAGPDYISGDGWRHTLPPGSKTAHVKGEGWFVQTLEGPLYWVNDDDGTTTTLSPL